MQVPVVFIGITLLIALFYIKVRRSDASSHELLSRFLSDERAANFSRKRDIEPEEYLIPDLSRLPVREYPDDDAYIRVRGRQQDALALGKLPMVRLERGTDNRRLKLKYGIANLDAIITYEENYNLFMHSLLEWATALISIKSTADAVTVLETAIELNCDRSQAYTLLADILASERERIKLITLSSRLQRDDNLIPQVKTKAAAYIESLIQQL